jgi:hypothetical protein
MLEVPLALLQAVARSPTASLGMEVPMVACVAEQRKEGRQGMQPAAKSLWDMLKSEEAKIRERLAAMKEEYDLAVVLHAPSETVIRIVTIAYFPDSNDTLRVQGIDVRTREACHLNLTPNSRPSISRAMRLDARCNGLRPRVVVR